jgi:hypothetical protein
LRSQVALRTVGSSHPLGVKLSSLPTVEEYATEKKEHSEIIYKYAVALQPYSSRDPTQTQMLSFEAGDVINILKFRPQHKTSFGKKGNTQGWFLNSIVSFEKAATKNVQLPPVYDQADKLESDEAAAEEEEMEEEDEEEEEWEMAPSLR